MRRRTDKSEQSKKIKLPLHCHDRFVSSTEPLELYGVDLLSLFASKPLRIQELPLESTKSASTSQFSVVLGCEVRSLLLFVFMLTVARRIHRTPIVMTPNFTQRAFVYTVDCFPSRNIARSVVFLFST